MLPLLHVFWQIYLCWWHIPIPLCGALLSLCLSSTLLFPAFLFTPEVEICISNIKIFPDKVPQWPLTILQPLYPLPVIKICSKVFKAKKKRRLVCVPDSPSGLYGVIRLWTLCETQPWLTRAVTIGAGEEWPMTAVADTSPLHIEWRATGINGEAFYFIMGCNSREERTDYKWDLRLQRLCCD